VKYDNLCYHSVQKNLSSRLLPRKRKSYNNQDYSFGCGSVCVWNLVSNIKGRLKVFEENIWTEDGRNDGRVEDTACRELSSPGR
jgi:hypothetical protein